MIFLKTRYELCFVFEAGIALEQGSSKYAGRALGRYTFANLASFESVSHPFRAKRMVSHLVVAGALTIEPEIAA